MTASVIEHPTGRTRYSRSHSQLNDFLHCGWAYRLKRVKKVPEHPSVWLAGGKAFHSATEDFDRAVFGENDPARWPTDPDQWIEAFHQHFETHLDEMREQNPQIDDTQWRTAGRKTKAKPNGEDVAWWAEAGPGFVTKYVDWRVSTVDNLRIAAVKGSPGIEVEVMMPLGGVPMKGYVDRIFEDPSTGTLLVVDLKSGSRTPDTPLQLATYSLQLEPLTERPVVWGAYYDARKGSLSEPIDLTRFNTGNVGLIYSTLDRSIEQANFLPNLGSHCKACGVRSACIFQGGTEPSDHQQ